MSALVDRIPLVLERASLAAEVTGRGVKLRRSGRELVGLCPIHPDRNPSFTVNPDGGKWYCHGCQRGGDVVNLVEEVDGVSRAEAISRLADKYGVMRPARSGRAPKSVTPTDFAPDELDRYLEEAHQRLLSGDDMRARSARGYLRGRAGKNVGDDARRWRLGIGGDSPNRKLRCLRNRIVFGVPPWGAEGRGVPGLEAHTWNPSQKYITVGPKRAWGARDVPDGGPVVLCEGPFDRIALERAGAAAVALRGKTVNPDDVQGLRRKVGRVYLALDGDTTADDFRRVASSLRPLQALPVRGLDQGDFGDLLALPDGDLTEAVQQALEDPLPGRHVVRIPLNAGGRP